MFYFIYNSLLIVLMMAVAPLLPLLLLWPRGRVGLSQRLGFLPLALRQQALIHEGSLWVHAASLG